MALWQRFLREMKASPSKAGVLIVLTAVGMYFWIPPIWNSLAGGATVPPVDQSETSAADTHEAVAAASDPAPPKSLRWHELEKIRASDVLFQTAAVSEVNIAAFGAPAAPPPIVKVEQEPNQPAEEDFAAERNMREEEQRAAARAAVDEIVHQLNLRSTMVGPVRRAAVINNRVYSEGEVVVVASGRAKVQSVESRRVKLEVNGESVELRIDPFASSQVRLDR